MTLNGRAGVREADGHSFAFPSGAAHAGTNALTVVSPQPAVLRTGEIALPPQD